MNELWRHIARAGLSAIRSEQAYSLRCPSDSASSWKRPLRSTSQVSVQVTAPKRAGVGKGVTRWIISRTAAVTSGACDGARKTLICLTCPVSSST